MLEKQEGPSNSNTHCLKSISGEVRQQMSTGIVPASAAEALSEMERLGGSRHGE